MPELHTLDLAITEGLADAAAEIRQATLLLVLLKAPSRRDARWQRDERSRGWKFLLRSDPTWRGRGPAGWRPRRPWARTWRACGAGGIFFFRGARRAQKHWGKLGGGRLPWELCRTWIGGVRPRSRGREREACAAVASALRTRSRCPYLPLPAPELAQGGASRSRRARADRLAPREASSGAQV